MLTRLPILKIKHKVLEICNNYYCSVMCVNLQKRIGRKWLLIPHVSRWNKERLRGKCALESHQLLHQKSTIQSAINVLWEARCPEVAIIEKRPFRITQWRIRKHRSFVIEPGINYRRLCCRLRGERILVKL